MVRSAMMDCWGSSGKTNHDALVHSWEPARAPIPIRSVSGGLRPPLAGAVHEPEIRSAADPPETFSSGSRTSDRAHRRRPLAQSHGPSSGREGGAALLWLHLLRRISPGEFATSGADQKRTQTHTEQSDRPPESLGSYLGRGSVGGGVCFLSLACMGRDK